MQSHKSYLVNAFICVAYEYILYCEPRMDNISLFEECASFGWKTAAIEYFITPGLEMVNQKQDKTSHSIVIRLQDYRSVKRYNGCVSYRSLLYPSRKQRRVFLWALLYPPASSADACLANHSYTHILVHQMRVLGSIIISTYQFTRCVSQWSLFQ